MRLIGLVTLLMIGAPAARAADTPLGDWARSDGAVKIRIAPCGGALCAENTWVKDTSDGEAVGDVLVMRLTPQPQGGMAGDAYDAKRKSTYHMDLSVAPSTIVSRGCILSQLLCREVSWTRIN